MPSSETSLVQHDGLPLFRRLFRCFQNFHHEQGLVSVLRQIHDDLDAAVADAYGWPVELSDEEILERLVALNHERAEEEKRGLIRWLRPECQNPDGATQQTMLPDAKDTKKKTTNQKTTLA